jgi:hypothetical protein
MVLSLIQNIEVNDYNVFRCDRLQKGREVTIYSTSQKLGNTYSFKSFSLFFTIFYVVKNDEMTYGIM